MNRTELFDANGVWDGIVGTYSIGQDVIRPVRKVVPALGVFVGLEPNFDALIHESKISGLEGQDPRRFYASGQMVTAKVINIDPHTRRVELATDLCEFSFDGFLSETDQPVADNVDLADLEVTGAVLQGGAISCPLFARAEFVMRSETEMSLQLQAKAVDFLKAVHIVFRKDGEKVLCRADWGAYTKLDHDFGYDLTPLRDAPQTDAEGGMKIAESADAEGYGVAKIYFRRKPSKTAQPRNGNEIRTAKNEAKPILVDGSNIVLRWPNLRSQALAGLLEGLKSNGYVPTVFFDANIRHVLQNSGDVFGQNLLECMMRESPEHTVIVPAGVRSDDYMLLLADRRGYQIVSCDTYRDEAFAKYSWLKNLVESGEKRVHAPAFILGDLVIPTLGIVWPFAYLPLEKNLVGEDVFIQSCGNGEYFCADDGNQGPARRILANRDNPSAWEVFVISRNPDGSVSIKSKVNDLFVSAEIDSDGRLNARANEIREWERLWASRRENDGRIVLRSCANMRYVSVDPQSGQVAARAESAGESELLTITPCAQIA